MLIVAVWILCCVIAWSIGSRKGIGPASFWIGLLLGPIGVVWVAVDKGHRVECRFCRELIHPEAVVCPHCQRDIAVPPTPAVGAR